MCEFRAKILAFYKRLQLAGPLCRHSSRILYQKSHCAHSFDFWYVNNSCVNTVLPLFPWSILYLFFAKLVKTSAIFYSSTKTTQLPRLLLSIFFQLPIKLSNVYGLQWQTSSIITQCRSLKFQMLFSFSYKNQHSGSMILIIANEATELRSEVASAADL